MDQRTHKTIRLRSPLAPAFDAEVDVGIVDIIAECWRAGIRTYSSCENDDGFVFIGIKGGHAAELFFRIVVPPYSPRIDGLFNRITSDIGIYTDDDKTEWLLEKRMWQFDVSVQTFAPRLWVQVRFPLDDYDYVLKRLREWNLT